MNQSSRDQLAFTCINLGLPSPGNFYPAQLIAADNDTLTALVRAAPGSTTEEIVSYLTGGNITIAGFASIWANRVELLEGFNRIQANIPEMFVSSLPTILITALAQSDLEMLTMMAESSLQAALAVLPAYSLPTLRKELVEMSEFVESAQEILLEDGAIEQQDQAAILGFFLNDMEGTKDEHVLALSFMSPLWRILFVLLAEEEEFLYAESVSEAVNSFVSQTTA